MLTVAKENQLFLQSRLGKKFKVKRKYKHLDYYEALQIIKESGREGITQAEFWKKIGGTSREGSRITAKLLKLGLISRERKLFKGKWTYILTSNKDKVNLDSIIDIPCTFCILQDKCGEEKYVTPAKCSNLTEYIEKLAKSI